MATIQHNTVQEAAASHEEAMHIVIKNGKWMAVVWYEKDGELHMLRRTTCEFPKNREAAAAALLVENLIQSAEAPKDNLSPLPSAPFVRQDNKEIGNGESMPAAPKLPPLNSTEEKGTE